MPIPPIGPVPGMPMPAPSVQQTTPTGGGNFGAKIAEGLEQLQELHDTSDDMAMKAATGDLTNVHDYMIASTRAAVATELTVAVRNRAVDAFSTIMRMRI